MVINLNAELKDGSKRSVGRFNTDNGECVLFYASNALKDKTKVPIYKFETPEGSVVSHIYLDDWELDERFEVTKKNFTKTINTNKNKFVF